MQIFNPIPILHDPMSDDRCDVNGGGNVDATGSVHDGDGDDIGAMGYANQNPTNQMLSPILSTELTVILQQVVVIPLLQYR
ncbi:hypothetical protein WUBG_18591 [Wuchereria bancrofti]|uniref:Uncharacterized protein n=1 Tax=Wuchereria bancrofti TaxID=6293 RepID=J9E0R7_WUCBA|nr:hypothetical protein WUBG_18591 [Wuchereria bancrofti]VDM21940.1 unnamed protein product [Wuchereria bancrofti]